MTGGPRGTPDSVAGPPAPDPMSRLDNRALAVAFETLADLFDREHNPAEFSMHHLRVAIAAYLGAAVPAPPAGPSPPALAAAIKAAYAEASRASGMDIEVPNIDAALRAAYAVDTVRSGAPPAGLTVETLAALLLEMFQRGFLTHQENAAWLLPRLGSVADECARCGAAACRGAQLVTVCRECAPPLLGEIRSVGPGAPAAGFEATLAQVRRELAPLTDPLRQPALKDGDPALRVSAADSGGAPAARLAPTDAMIAAAWRVVSRWEVRSADNQHGSYMSVCDECDGYGEAEAPETIAHTPTCVIGALRAALAAQDRT